MSRIEVTRNSYCYSVPEGIRLMAKPRIRISENRIRIPGHFRVSGTLPWLASAQLCLWRPIAQRFLAVCVRFRHLRQCSALTQYPVIPRLSPESPEFSTVH